MLENNSSWRYKLRACQQFAESFLSVPAEPRGCGPWRRSSFLSWSEEKILCVKNIWNLQMKLTNKKNKALFLTIGFKQIKQKINSLVNVWCFECHPRQSTFSNPHHWFYNCSTTTLQFKTLVKKEGISISLSREDEHRKWKIMPIIF